jgi:hypothetical protein
MIGQDDVGRVAESFQIGRPVGYAHPPETQAGAAQFTDDQLGIVGRVFDQQDPE